MSLIHTCQLNGVNPCDYLLALQKHAAQAGQAPTQWLPWKYQQTLGPGQRLSRLAAPAQQTSVVSLK
jgi:hypothetical protein